MWLLDVNVTTQVQQLLEARGEDVVTLIDLGYWRFRNSEILSKMKELTCVLLSYDRDFIQLTHDTHPGVIVDQIHQCLDEEVFPVMEPFLSNLSPENLPNHLIVLDRTKIIIRNPETGLFFPARQ